MLLGGWCHPRMQGLWTFRLRWSRGRRVFAAAPGRVLSWTICLIMKSAGVVLIGHNHASTHGARASSAELWPRNASGRFNHQYAVVAQADSVASGPLATNSAARLKVVSTVQPRALSSSRTLLSVTALSRRTKAALSRVRSRSSTTEATLSVRLMISSTRELSSWSKTS